MPEEKIKVLIVDDSSFMIKVLKGMLDGTEFEVVAYAQDGQEALEKFKVFNPDVVLLDIIMPSITGTQLLVKLLYINPGTKVVMVSSLGTEEKVVECLRAGAKNFIQKPFEQKDLLRELRNLKAVEIEIPTLEPKTTLSFPGISLGMKFFGEYLLEKGVITKEHLLGALEFQKRINFPLETIVLEKGYLSGEDLMRLREIQKKNLDKDIGDIMVEQGFLTKDALHKLLKEQKEKHVYIGEALVKVGAIDFPTLEKELKAYREEQEQEEWEITKGLERVKNQLIVKAFIDYTVKIFQKIIGEQIKVKVCLPQTSIFSLRDFTIEQNITGEQQLSFMLNLSKDIALTVSSAMFRKQIETINADSEDALKEFLNIITGNTCTKLSTIDLKFDATPPIFYDNKTKNQYPLKENEEITFVSLISTIGDFDLLVKAIKK